MGIILYKPHCGKCGAIITQKVMCRHIKVKSWLPGDSFIEIEPSRCLFCGEVFKTIEIPLPEEEGEDR